MSDAYLRNQALPCVKTEHISKTPFDGMEGKFLSLIIKGDRDSKITFSSKEAAFEYVHLLLLNYGVSESERDKISIVGHKEGHVFISLNFKTMEVS